MQKLASESSRARAQTSSQRDWKRAVIPAFLLTIYAAQCVWFVRTQSLTYDEPVHIAEGLDAWRNGRFEQYNDHPPLARLLCTLPILSPRFQVKVQSLPAGFEVHQIFPDPISLAWRSRAVNIVLGLLLGILLWVQAERLFSASAASFMLVLFAFSPSLIAHFSLVTTDGIATLTIFATAVQMVRWKRNPDFRNAFICGLVFGLLLLSKFSTVPIFALAILLMLALVRGRFTLNFLRWNFVKTAFAILIAVFVVWAGYFFHTSRLTIHDGVLTATHPNGSAPLVKPTRSKLNLSLAVPAGEYLAGLRDVTLRNAHGQPAFFLGQISPRGGWKAYYPVTILLKWPLLSLLLASAGVLLCATGKVRAPDIWLMAVFPALYFSLAIFAHFNIGERHILPIYPFALMFAAAAWQGFPGIKFGSAILVGVVALNAVDALRYAPGYLSYFDPFVPSHSSYRLLADSNVDWGQGLLSLREYQRRHPGDRVWLAYFGSVDPALYGIMFRPLPENQRVAGTVVVSATDLAGEYLKNPDGYKWLLQYPRVEVLDHCLYVFQIDH